MSEFDQFAKDYRQLHNDNLKHTGFDTFHFIDVKVNCLARHEADKPMLWLDLGCGDGYTAEYMYRKFPSWKIEGIEVSAESIEEAKQKHAPNAHFQWFNGKDVPFKDNTFDAIFIACIFHHVPQNEHASLLQEAMRVLKPGGKLYVFEHNPYNPGTQYLVKTCAFDGNAKLISHRYFKKLFRRQGWIINHVNFIVFFPGWGVFKKLVPLEKYLSWLPIGGQYYFQLTKPA